MTVKLSQFYKLYLLAIVFVTGLESHAQAVKIHEGPANKSGICEPKYKVDPTNPMNIYAASILDNFYQSRTADAVGHTKRFQVLLEFGEIRVSLPIKMAGCITST